MTKSNLPQSQISFTPSNELVINYPKPTLKNRLFSKENFWGTIISILSIITSITLTIFDIYEQTAIILFAVAASQIPSILSTKGIYQITFHKRGLVFKNYKYKIEKHSIDSSSFVDFKIQFINDSFDLKVDKHIIHFDDIKKLPLVIESIANTWDLEYYDTIAIDEHNQVLTYKSKSIIDEEADSLLQIDDNDSRITFRDTLSSSKFFATEKATGKLFSDKLGQGTNAYLKLTKNDAIDIEAVTNLGASNECEIRIDVIDVNGQIRTVFVSDKRYEGEKIITYRDVELIYDELKKLPILENIIVEKHFR